MRKLIGGVLAVLVLGSLVAIVVTNRQSNETANGSGTDVVTIRGVIGSEKRPFFDDAEVQAALASQGLKVDYQTAGSREIATTINLDDFDFAFPSSAPAAQKIQEKTKTSQAFSPFYSPMAIASYEPVMQLLAQNGAATKAASGVWSVDMAAYLRLADSGTRWNQLMGAAGLYNSPRSVLLRSTDIRRSNSAAMYLSIGAYVLNDNNVVVSTEQQQAVIPALSRLFLAQGFSSNSSEEPFEDYLSQGSGAYPMLMIYESQFVGEAAKGQSRVSADMALAYPEPTVFSKHTLIPFSPEAAKLGAALTSDPTLQRLAAQYGFRTTDTAAFNRVVTEHGVAAAPSLANVTDPPSYDVLESMITAVSAQYEAQEQ